MKGKTTKGSSANTANPPRTSASPGTIRKYMVQDSGKNSPGKQKEIKIKTPECTPRIGTRRQTVEADTHIGSSETTEVATMEPQQKKLLPTKSEMAEMFAKLEVTIKGEIGSLREEMNHMLQRVEEAETKMDKQNEEIKELKFQMEELQREQRNLRYRAEDQENRSRRKNLRIRGLPEPQGGTEDLQGVMDDIFGRMVYTPENVKKIKFERIHRIRKPAEIKGEVPRDVIARFHKYSDKEKVKENLKKNYPVKYGETKLQIFPDLAAETLARRRILKPLLEQLNAHDVHYSWGFPACLIGRKDGRSATLRFPEETAKFCDRLEVPLVEIPGWWVKTGDVEAHGIQQAWKPIFKTRKP